MALVIGNAKYLHAAHLPNPANDADVITASLKRAEFNVIEKKDLTQEQMRYWVLKFGDSARNADVAVIYYAGHGIQRDGVDYLIPVDAALRTPASLGLEAVTADSVLNVVAEAHKMRLLILDACRENPFNTGTRGGSHGLVPIAGVSDTVTAYSAKQDTVALDGTAGGNSPYASSLARHIDESGVELDQMFREVRDDVMVQTREAQEPFVYDSRGRGNFYFHPGKLVSNTIVQMAAKVDPQQIELEMWRSVEGSNDAIQYNAYLKHYPDGLFADVAHAKIAALLKGSLPASAPAPAQAASKTGATPPKAGLRRF